MILNLYFKTGEYAIVLKTAWTGTWDVKCLDRTFHISQEEEVWLLNKLLNEHDIVSLPDLKNLHYTGRKIEDANPFEFALLFLQEHVAYAGDKKIPCDELYLQRGGFQDLREYGRHISRKERFWQLGLYTSLNGICITLLQFLFEVNINWWIIPACLLIAMVCFCKTYELYEDTLTKFMPQIMLACGCVLFGCLFKGAGSGWGFDASAIGTLACIGAFILTAGGSLMFFLLMWHVVLILINR